MEEEEGATLEYTPTWVVAVVCTVIVFISLAVERILHLIGKFLKRKNLKALFQALTKIKEELMLMGFISLLLGVLQQRINSICIPEELATKWLPCDEPLEVEIAAESSSCPEGQVPMLSMVALHHLHIFIFVLACVHVTFCALTILIGSGKIAQWKRWEDAVLTSGNHTEEVGNATFTQVQDDDFIRKRYRGNGKDSVFQTWIVSFFKQFYGSIAEYDYTTLRLGFIMTHCRGNPNFNFHSYILRAYEADFKKVVGISWYLWIFVAAFLLVDVDGWNSYFWVAVGYLVLLLAVGTKLEHVITQLAQDVAEKHIAVEGNIVVKPSDEHFWLGRPKLILTLIHIILFQNSFELAFFFWIWFLYGVDSCIMGGVEFVVPRLVIGILVQFICSYSTLPLYAIVTQMGSSFKKAIFDEHIQEVCIGWAKVARKKTKLAGGDAPGRGGSSRREGSGSTLLKPATEE
ncbi:MLO-like protein 1 [Euphorbia lathyris]|uniref:MLO-like protein 1 n=1 Tax=Euphorbia lathyris TaxID=212925 RepID=UPI003313EC78